MLSLYYTSDLLSLSLFIPFLQNKKIQQKVINTLLYIYNNPLQNNHFPHKLRKYYIYNSTKQYSQKFEWSQQEGAADKIRQNIVTIFMQGFTKTFYLEENYLDKVIGFKGIKDIVYNPIFKIETQQKGYKPIYEIIQLILTKEIKKVLESEAYQVTNIFSIFKGVSSVPPSQTIQLITLLKRIHYISVNQSSFQIPINQDNITQRINKQQEYKLQVNLRNLLANESFKESIRNTFPITDEERDPFFVSLFFKSNIYSRDQLLNFHKRILQNDVENSSNVYYVNKGFELYFEQKQMQFSQIKQSKNIIPTIIKFWPKPNKNKIKSKPFYLIHAYTHLLNLQAKQQLLIRHISDFKQELNFDGNSQFIAHRKKGIFESAFLDLRNKPDRFWLQSFTVKFMNEEGAIESGYGKGVAKDWYSYVTKGMVNLNYGIFMKTQKNYYFFNRQSWINPRHLQFLQFIGKLFALSIINSQFYLAPNFSILIYKMILGQKIEIDDIVKQFDEGEVIKNIDKLRSCENDSLIYQTFVYEDKRLIANRNLELLKQRRSIQSIQAGLKQRNLYLLKETVEIKQQEYANLQRNQQAQIEEQDTTKTIKVLKIGEMIELIPGGSSIPVNKSNLDQFIQLTKQKIYDLIVNGVKQQFNAFVTGFRRVIKPEFIKHMSAVELRQIAEGCDVIDVDDLKKYVKVKGLQNSDCLKWFWDTLQKLSSRDQMYLIQHWTGLPKISVEGFKDMNLQIVKGRYQGRLFAQTCFNTLHLPELDSPQKMEDMIKMAVVSVKLGESFIED